MSLSCRAKRMWPGLQHHGTSHQETTFQHSSELLLVEMSSSRFQLLESRLNALHEAHKNTIQLINRLTNSKQQTSAHSESDLISEIHDNLKAEDEELDILRQELQDSTYSEATFRAGSEREKEQAALAVQVARLGEDFKQFVGLI